MNKQQIMATLEALFVTILWSSSWILIKVGLTDIPALVFAGLRYFLAFLVLLIWFIASSKHKQVRQVSKNEWLYLIALGLVMYFFTQGAQFLGLSYLPTVQVSLFLNMTPIIVMIFGIRFLNEKPSLLQGFGVLLFVCAATLYFYPFTISPLYTTGYIIMLIGVISNAVAVLIGRKVNRDFPYGPLLITVISMGIGGSLLLLSGIISQGFPILSLRSWLIIGWLAVVNTAFAFTLWNHSQKTLTATQSSIINSTMLVQIAILSWIFLGNTLDIKGIIAIVLATIGIVLVQIRITSNVPKKEY